MLDIPSETANPTRERPNPASPVEAADEEAFWADIPVSVRENVGVYDSDTAGGCG